MLKKLYYLGLFILTFSLFFVPTVLYAQSTTPWSFYNNPIQSNAMDIFYNGVGAANPAIRLKTNGQTSVGTLQLTYDAGLPSGGYSIRRGTAMEFRGGTGGYSFINNANTSTSMTILNSGQIGIGNGNPQAPLEVGDASLDGSNGHLRSSSRSGGGARSWDFGTSYGSFTNFNFNIKDTGMSAPALSIAYGTGNVGIGTTNPGAKIDVIQANDSTTGGYRQWNTAQNQWGTFYVGADRSFYFQHANGYAVLDASGNFHTQGGVVYGLSDSRLKHSVAPLANSLDKVLNLQGITFQYNQVDHKGRKLPQEQQIGVVAQDLEKVIPQLVITDEEGYKSVDYVKLGVVLVEAVKEQQKQIDELKQEVQDLKSHL